MGRAIFCPGCQKILDVRNAVSADATRSGEILHSKIACAQCFDRHKAALREAAERLGLALEVLDGRELFGGRTKRRG